MKKVLFIVTALAFTACIGDGKPPRHDHDHSHDHNHDHDHENDQNHTESESHEATDSHVQLNDGERWQANAETTEGIRNMREITGEYLAQEEADIEKLKSELNREFKLIFERCTMKGESHEQLHNYLHPLKHRMEALDETSTRDDLTELQAYLEEYGEYFE